jgi:hypothetical protein
MKKTYTTAQGKNISIDNVRLSNEDVIAVGNMKVNARGDALGPGGVPEGTRQQAVTQYYNLHTPVVGAPVANAPGSGVIESKPVSTPTPVAPVLSADPLIDEQDAAPITEPKLRGSLADSVAKTSKPGPSRI